MRSDLQKYNPYHDDRGRFTSAGGADDGDSDGGALSHIKGAINGAALAMRQHAEDLASKVRQLITSTRITGISPTPSGGVEIRARHNTSSHSATIQTHAQIHPWMLGNPVAQRALGILHDALVASGAAFVANKHPPLGASFINAATRVRP